jgi:hypothetical protein
VIAPYPQRVTESRRLRGKLEGELDRAAWGDRAVRFTPLLALEKKVVEMREGIDRRG